MNNKKGMFVIEMSFALALFIACLGFLEIISQGWTHRMEARLCSRYVSTFYFRHHALPSLNRLKENFGLQGSTNLTIQNPKTVSIEFHPIFKKTILKIKMSFYLWTKSF
ncbi:MAG: hypothetical protein HYY61_07320 [Deltaproteobacteria bacterium]|nr:hypothetical protein [Deltaproteobacteria bacterium]